MWLSAFVDYLLQNYLSAAKLRNSFGDLSAITEIVLDT
jgi:hypothetical protein